MRVAFASFKEIIVIAGLVYMITGILAVVTTPNGAGGRTGGFGLRRSGQQGRSIAICLEIENARQ